MIKGMTGFGTAQIAFKKIKGGVELKSQNHRYFDIVYYLPNGFSAFENKIKEQIGKQISRGRVSVGFKILEKPEQEIVFNKDIIKGYLKNAREAQKEFGLKNDLSLADLMKMPGVVTVKETNLEPEILWPMLSRAIEQALKTLMQMRNCEGKSLAADIRKILAEMSAQDKGIGGRIKALLKDKQQTLTPEEFLVYQKGSDINEELTRLNHYIEEFRRLLSADGSVGKQLDFVAQEMQRETNTIGSKVQDKIVSDAVVLLKSKIEKLRELAQNIE